MQPTLVLACLCVIGMPMVHGTSNRVLDFMSFYNGDFDNEAQTKKPNDNHDYVISRFIPVDIECLRPNQVLFIEEDVNGAIELTVLAVITEGIEDTVSLAVYNFSEYRKYKPREFKGENLFNMSCDVLQGDGSCVASYIVANGSYVFGNFPLCGYTGCGRPLLFTSYHTCDYVIATMPQNTLESHMEPYDLRLRSKKYPLINPPEGYEAPCRNY